MQLYLLCKMNGYSRCCNGKHTRHIAIKEGTNLLSISHQMHTAAFISAPVVLQIDGLPFLSM